MDPPGITRHRRPFLAPVWLGMIAVLVVGGMALLYYRSASTTLVLLVTAVEKEPGAIDDPPLSADGEQLAQRLAQMFGDAAGRLDYPGGTVLVIASRATLAQFIHELQGTEVSPARGDSDFLYVVAVPSIGRGQLARIRL